MLRNDFVGQNKYFGFGLKGLLGLITLTAGITVNAALLTPNGSAGSIEKVSMPQSAQAQVEGEAVSLQSVGYGLRTKKVVFVNVKVYLGQLFVADLAGFKKQDALASTKGQKAVAIQMHFLRNVDGENVQKSFQDALKANAVKLTDADVKQFLEVVKTSGEAKEGHKMTIVGSKLADGQEAIVFENTQGQVSEIKSATGFIEKIFSIWLGKSADGGVENLKNSILK